MYDEDPDFEEWLILRQPTNNIQEFQVDICTAQKRNTPNFLKIAYQFHAKVSLAGKKIEKMHSLISLKLQKTSLRLMNLFVWKT